MEWVRLRNYIIRLHQFEVQSELKAQGKPAGILAIPRVFLELALEELSPVAFKVFIRLYSMLDFQLRTHWVIGISTDELAKLCRVKKAKLYNALDELKSKTYIHILSGKKAKKKAKAIRKYIYGSATDLGGNDYNAYSLLPFFTRVFIELESQALEEGENAEPLPSDEEIFEELPEKTKNAFKALPSKGEKDTSVYIDEPQSNKTNLSLNRHTLVKEYDNNQRHTSQRNTTKDTHTNERSPAEKNRTKRPKPADADADQTPEPSRAEPQNPPPADRLPEPVYEVLVDYLSRQEGVKNPIAVLKRASEKDIEMMAREVLREFLSDPDLKEEIRRLPDLPAVNLLEYALLSDEGRLKWLEEKGISLSEPETELWSEEKIVETIRELVVRLGTYAKIKDAIRSLFRKEEELQKARAVWQRLKKEGRVRIDKENDRVEWAEL